MANIREQCSWVHEDRDSATEKAIALTRSAVAKGNLLSPLEEQEVDVIPRTLVIGGGIAGMQAALDIADAGFEVVLVERDPSIGGHMAQLDKTFPTLDCSACILTPRMVEVAEHPRIRLYTHSEVENITGYIGNFEIDIRKKARYVDEEKCTSCGDCMTACPVRNVPEIQPVHDYSAETEPEERKRLDAILARFSSSPPAKEMLIQILQSINDEYNYLPEYALKYLSQKIEVPLSQVYHAATFYTAFSLEPRGKHVIKVCMGTACHTRGALRVLEELERRLEVGAGGTTEDLFFTLETVNCLGCCALAPVVVVDEDYHASMVPSKVEKMLAMYRDLES
jgi:NADH:ubiquinone oxidoreductase subunit E